MAYICGKLVLSDLFLMVRLIREIVAAIAMQSALLKMGSSEVKWLVLAQMRRMAYLLFSNTSIHFSTL